MPGMKTVELQVQGMSCGHCVKAVREALTGVEGVQRADVELGRAQVECDDTVPRDALVAALTDAGYEVG
jgi:copper chaperone